MIRTYGCALFAMIAMSPPPALAEDRVKPVDWPAAPPVAAQRPVTETFFGTTLTDPYRYMETFGDAETLAWMHAQAVFTRSILDTIPARAAYLHRLGELGNAFGWISSYTEAGGRAFYLERPAGADVSDLMVRDADGRTRKLVDVAALIAATGKPHAVSYLTPSKDGSRIAVGIAAGGSEQADLRRARCRIPAIVSPVRSRIRAITPTPFARTVGSRFNNSRCSSPASRAATPSSTSAPWSGTSRATRSPSPAPLPARVRRCGPRRSPA